MEAVIYIHVHEDAVKIVCFNEIGKGKAFETVEQARKHCLNPTKVKIETIIHEFDNWYD